MADTSADVPNVYDVVIDGHGYILANTVEPSLPFRTQRAALGYTPTFISRQNVSGDLGDNQQDFWLTASMRDWSLGEDQKFYRISDPDKQRQYWLGSNVNVQVPGQVTIQRTTTSASIGSAASGSGSWPAGGYTYTSTSTTLYKVDSSGTATSLGAHGCGGVVTSYATDGVNLYVSGAACSKTRKMVLASGSFSDFSATAMDDLVFLNNTLYGVHNGTFYVIDTGGNALSSFVWKDATGTELVGTMKIEAFGGKVMIMRSSGSTNGAELWQYDGTGVSKLAEYPANFAVKNLCVQSGIVFFIGTEGKVGDGSRTALWYYANGTIGRAWANTTYTTSSNLGCDVTPFGNGLIFTDAVNGVIRFYDLQIGGVSSVASYTAATNVYLNTCNNFVLLSSGATSVVVYPSSTVATSGYVQTSIVDFDSSLTKLFRGVIVDWVAATDGDGGSVDIAYQVDSVDGAYTSLQTGAASGTEYNFSGGVTGRGLSLKITINKGTSTLGPTVKRIYLRAAPTLTRFRKGEYIIDMTGVHANTPVMRRNNTPHPLSGQQQLNNLITSATSGTPVNITDHLGTFTGIIDLETTEAYETSPNEYLVRVNVRGV